MAFWQHGSFTDANGNHYSNVPVNNNNDNGTSGNNITPAKTIGGFYISNWGIFPSKKWSDTIEYNKYLNTVTFSPFLGTDNVTPILQPAGSARPISVKFQNSIYIQEMLQSFEFAGFDGRPGDYFNEFIISHTSKAMFKKMSRIERWVINPNDYTFQGITNKKFNGQRQTNAPEYLDGCANQTKEGQLFYRQGGKENFRQNLAKFKYYGANVKQRIYTPNETKLKNYVINRLGLSKNIVITNEYSRILDNTSELFWKIALNRAFKSDYLGGLSFQVKPKGMNRKYKYSVDVAGLLFQREDGVTADYIETDDYIICFDQTKYINDRLFEKYKDTIKSIINGTYKPAESKLFSYLDSTYRYANNITEPCMQIDDIPVSLLYPVKPYLRYDYFATTAQVQAGTAKQIDAGGKIRITQPREPIERGDTDDTSNYKDYVAIPREPKINGNTGGNVGGGSTGTIAVGEVYIHSRFESNESKYVSADRHPNINATSWKNTIIELPVASQVVPKEPKNISDMNDINYFYVDTDSYLNRLSQYMYYPFIPYKDTMTMNTNDVYNINMLYDVMSSTTQGMISTYKVRPLVQLKQLTNTFTAKEYVTTKTDISTDFPYNPDGDVTVDDVPEIPTQSNTAQEVNDTDIIYSPFISLITDIKYDSTMKNVPISGTVNSWSGGINVSQRGDIKYVNSPAEEWMTNNLVEEFTFNTQLASLMNQFTTNAEVVVIEYIENGIKKEDFIVYTEDELELAGKDAYTHFKDNTYNYTDGTVFALPFASMYFADNPIAQKTHDAVECIMIVLPLPPYIIPLLFPRKGKALYAQTYTDGFYHVGDKYHNLFLQRKQLPVKYFERFEDPGSVRTYPKSIEVGNDDDPSNDRDLVIDNRKRVPRTYGDKSFMHYMERPLTRMRGGDSWNQYPYAPNYPDGRNIGTTIETRAKNNLNFGESYQAYYQTDLNITKYYLGYAFSFTYMLNNGLRGTVHPCKMAYQYIDTLFKLNNLQPSSNFTSVLVHFPHRIGLKSFVKSLRIKKRELTTDELNGLQSSYQAWWVGDELCIGSKGRGYVCSLDFESYLPSYKSLYGFNPSGQASMSPANLRTDFASMWVKYYQNVAERNKLGYPASATIQDNMPYETMKDCISNYLDTLSNKAIQEAYEFIYNTKVAVNDFNQSDSPLEIDMEYRKYSPGYTEIKSMSVEGDPVIPGGPPSITTEEQEVTFELMMKKIQKEVGYSQELPGGFLGRLWELQTGKKITGNYPAPILTETTTGSDGSTSVVAKPEGFEPTPMYIYTPEELAYWYNKYLYTNYSNYSGRITSYQVDKNMEHDYNTYMSRNTIKEEIIASVTAILGTTEYMTTKDKYLSIFNATGRVVDYFNSINDPQYNWKRLFSEHVIIIPDQETANISSPNNITLKFILDTDAAIVTTGRSPCVSNPFLPMYEEFYKRLSYSNKHFCYRCMLHYQLVGGVVVPVEYKNGSRFNFVSSLIGFVGSLIVAYATWPAQIAGWAQMLAVASNVLNLVAQGLTVLAMLFGDSWLAEMLKSLASIAAIGASLASLGSSAINIYQNFSATGVPAGFLNSAKDILDAAAVTITITNKIVNMFLEYQLKQDQKKIKEQQEANERLQKELDKQKEDMITLGYTTYRPLNLDKYLDLDKGNNFTDMEVLTSTIYDEGLDFDTIYEVYD